jgi:hypothetical protein
MIRIGSYCSLMCDTIMTRTPMIFKGSSQESLTHYREKVRFATWLSYLCLTVSVMSRWNIKLADGHGQRNGISQHTHGVRVHAAVPFIFYIKSVARRLKRNGMTQIDAMGESPMLTRPWVDWYLSHFVTTCSQTVRIQSSMLLASCSARKIIRSYDAKPA